MEKYFRVKLKTERRAFNIRWTSEDARWLRGYEVDNNGDEVSGRDFERRLHCIEKDAIAKLTPLTMDVTYAMLIEPKDK